MRFHTLINNLKTAQQVIAGLGIVCVLLLLSNVLLAWLNVKNTKRASVYIVPTHISAPFKISQLHVDASYLQQMTLGFLNERFNVTPSTVDTSHQLLLQSVAPSEYHAVEAVLTREASDIKAGDISSVFYVDHYQIDPQTLTATVSGTLRWWFGEKKMTDHHAQYQLHYRWSGGRLTIVEFAQAKGETKS